MFFLIRLIPIETVTVNFYIFSHWRFSTREARVHIIILNLLKNYDAPQLEFV